MVCTLSFGEISNIHDGLHIRLASALLNQACTSCIVHIVHASSVTSTRRLYDAVQSCSVRITDGVGSVTYNSHYQTCSDTFWKRLHSVYLIRFEMDQLRLRRGIETRPGQLAG